jgi:5-methylcytosine-specific restriction protein A
MPAKPLKYCSIPGCPNKTRGSKCKAHGGGSWEGRHDRHAAGYGYDWTKRRNAHIKANPYCVLCGAKATDVDHVLNKARGGTDEASNLRSLCKRCHHRKTARDSNR